MKAARYLAYFSLLCLSFRWMLLSPSTLFGVVAYLLVLLLIIGVETDLFRHVLRAYMRWRYGVHGALRPPIGYTHFGCDDTVVYRGRSFERPSWTRKAWIRAHFAWRCFCWRVENKVYAWTGLPRRWHTWYRSSQ